jgi:hypothetical protein
LAHVLRRGFSNAWCDSPPSLKIIWAAKVCVDYKCRARGSDLYGVNLEHIFYRTQSALKYEDDPYLSQTEARS